MWERTLFIFATESLCSWKTSTYRWSSGRAFSSGSEDPLPADHDRLLQFDVYEIEKRIGGKNSPIPSTDPRFLGRSHQYNNHMKSVVMKMRDLSFIYMYVSTYEVETVFKDRCVILGNVETTNILGLVSELYRTNLFISETESLFSMKTQIEDVSDPCSW